MSESVTRTEFAARVGKTLAWISRLCKEGRIPVDEKNRIPWPEGLHAFEQIPRKDADDPNSPIDVAEVNRQYNQARMAEKKYKALLVELEYKQTSGELIPVEQVRADAHKTGAEIRERLQSIPPRVAVLCEGRPAREIERVVDEAINDALKSLSKSRFKR